MIKFNGMWVNPEHIVTVRVEESWLDGTDFMKVVLYLITTLELREDFAGTSVESEINARRRRDDIALEIDRFYMSKEQ